MMNILYMKIGKNRLKLMFIQKYIFQNPNLSYTHININNPQQFSESLHNHFNEMSKNLQID